MVARIIVIFIVILLLLLIGVGVYLWIRRIRENAEKNINDVIDSVNSVNYYTYNYEKTQNNNLKNVDGYVRKLANDMTDFKNDIKTLNDTKASVLDIYRLESERNIFNEVLISPYTFASTSNTQTGTNWLSVTSDNSNAMGMSVLHLQVNSNLYLTGDMLISKGISSKVVRNQPLIEYNDTISSARFGIGHYDPGMTRVYSSDRVNISKAKGDGTFTDIIQVRDSKVDISAPAMCMGGMCFVPHNSSMLLCPSDNPTPTNGRCKQITSL
jgi:type II secretory pathway pseudopilin PulG